MPTTVTVKRTVTEDDLREYRALEAELVELQKSDEARRLKEVQKALGDKAKEISAVVSEKKSHRVKAGPYIARLEENGRQAVAWAKEYEALAGDIAAQELRESQEPRYKLIVEGP